MRRAAARPLPVAYSQGFNPPCADLVCHGAVRRHQSRGEVMEVEMAGEISPEEFAEKLNACLPTD